MPMHIIVFVVLVTAASLSGCYIGQKLFGRYYRKCEFTPKTQTTQKI